MFRANRAPARDEDYANYWQRGICRASTMASVIDVIQDTFKLPDCDFHLPSLRTAVNEFRLSPRTDEYREPTDEEIRAKIPVRGHFYIYVNIIGCDMPGAFRVSCTGEGYLLDYVIERTNVLNSFVVYLFDLNLQYLIPRISSAKCGLDQYETNDWLESRNRSYFNSYYRFDKYISIDSPFDYVVELLIDGCNGHSAFIKFSVPIPDFTDLFETFKEYPYIDDNGVIPDYLLI